MGGPPPPSRSTTGRPLVVASRRLALLAVAAGGRSALLSRYPGRSGPSVGVDAFSVPVRFPGATTTAAVAVASRRGPLPLSTEARRFPHTRRRRLLPRGTSDGRSSSSYLPPPPSGGGRHDDSLRIRTATAAARDVDNDGGGGGPVDAPVAGAATTRDADGANGPGGSSVDDDAPEVETLGGGVEEISALVEEHTEKVLVGSPTDDSAEKDGETDDDGAEVAVIDAPSVRQILRFAIPAIGVWLCSPILSMIDTSAVGLLSGTAQQAALNPAVSVTDYGGLLVAFMYTATTNLVAAARQTDQNDPNKPLTAWTLKSALGLALLVGVGFGLFLTVFARVMLRALIGNDSLDPFIFTAALRYVRIRSLGMPAAVVIGTAQSACLGMQDLKSPLYVLLAAAVINFLGDAIFVRSASPWIGGAAGAAWATVFSQYAALWMFLRWFKTEPGRTRSRIAERMRTSRRSPNFSSPHAPPPPPTAEKDNSSAKSGGSGSSKGKRKGPPPSRGFLSGRFSVLDLFRLPDAKAVREFLPYVGPVTATAVGRISGYLAMSHVASSALGTIDMAAQQIIFSFFCCLTPVCDSLNLTAQSFVPPIFSREKRSRKRADALRRTLRSFLGAGVVMGAALVGLVAMIPFLGGFFTTDVTVMSQVTTAIPGLALFFALSGVVCVGEGMLLGQRDLKFLGNAYGAYFFAVPAVLLRLKRRALAGLQDVGVGTMWKTFSCYQVVRCAIWVIRMAQLQRRTEAESEGDAATGEIVITEPLGL